MQFAEPADQRIGRFRLFDHLEGRVFFFEPVQASKYLFFVALLLGGNGQRNARLREHDVGEHHRARFVTERVACVGMLKLGQRADVAGSQLLNADLFFALHYINLPELFGFAGVGVLYGLSNAQLSAENFENRKLAHKRVSH